MPELSPTIVEEEPTLDAVRRPPSPGWRRWAGDPGRVFVVLALAVGGYLALVVPHFAGIDEAGHFYRSYQISSGRLLPLETDRSDFSGACIPPDVVRGVLVDSIDVLAHRWQLEGAAPGTAPRPTLRGVAFCPRDRSRRLVTFSTFGSPVPYLPQAAGILVARTVGAGVDGMVLASRLASLAAYVGLVWFAIRRATRSRWAFCAVGLLPVALFQATVSASHDALTIAASLLVVASALRLVDREDVSQSWAIGEAVLLTGLLAACKPGYVVIAFCYWLPLLGRDRKRSLWPLGVVPIVGVLASVAWNEAVGGVWRTDAGMFGVAVDPARQRDLLVHRPWTFVGAVVHTVSSQLFDWVKGTITLGPSVAVWPAVGVVAALVLLALVSVQRAEREPRALDSSQRMLCALVAAVGSLMLLGAQYVYWSAPGDDTIGGMQARFFVPLLVLVPIALGPRRGRWANPRTATWPLVALLVPLYAVLLVTITFRMY